MLNSYTIISLFIALIAGCANGYIEMSIFDEKDINRVALDFANVSRFIVPGTKWCGPGSTAANYNDLGRYRDTDMCCREHDHCEVVISAQQSLHGIQNGDRFPIMQCSCEQKFINCLQKVNSVISHTLGFIYFGARGQCLELGHPIVHCFHYQFGTFGKRCMRYNVDEKKSKAWQLFDMPFYSFSFRDDSVEHGDNIEIDINYAMQIGSQEEVHNNIHIHP